MIFFQAQWGQLAGDIEEIGPWSNGPWSRALRSGLGNRTKFYLLLLCCCYVAALLGGHCGWSHSERSQRAFSNGAKAILIFYSLVVISDANKLHSNDSSVSVLYVYVHFMMYGFSSSSLSLFHCSPFKNNKITYFNKLSALVFAACSLESMTLALLLTLSS